VRVGERACAEEVELVRRARHTILRGSRVGHDARAEEVKEVSTQALEARVIATVGRGS
jgi:hypothetical protein